MRTYLHKRLFAAVLTVAASLGLGSSTSVHGEELVRYSGGASVASGSPARGYRAGLPREQAVYQAPAPAAGYWYYAPHPVYQVPASSPAPAAGYWYYAPQPIHQVPMTAAGYWHYYPVR